MVSIYIEDFMIKLSFSGLTNQYFGKIRLQMSGLV